MANYSIIKDGTVINVIVADEQFVSAYAADNGFTYVDHASYPMANIGATTVDGITFIDPNYQQTKEVVPSGMVEPTVTGATPL